jgi:pilus assembly protein CpaB
VAPGQILLSAMFAQQSKVTSGLALPDGKMAVTVETGVPEQVAGYVRPGSRVAVFLTFKLLDSQGKETKFQRTRVLLADVEVLTVGTYRPPNSKEGDSSSNLSKSNGSLLVTLAVNQNEAERLIEG